MAPLKTEIDFPAIRACIFDMDGLLINTEDIITLSLNQLLEKYGRPRLTSSIRALLMGVPDSTNGDVFHNWVKLPISHEQFARESKEQMRLDFPNCKPLPGAEKILSNLSLFEDSVAGVEAGRRAGMRVGWVLHPDVVVEYQARHEDVRAGRTGMFEIGDNWPLGDINDGFAESISNLDQFNYEKYGIECRT
ncbi:2-deoxyglucose-6-phosphate phosphatase, putative [Talaromyces stipitatus ATCC 10500]|uniref:2-deoxyglucose-6-phosphate phosphatase, putative n=1 Tax=Talaromyces stipitatus (strain ATCC 10500 / CBS 375.48 / QM 6759 / NRRL 1006) TaxID=441959 RepID=B8M4D3_TALSN|nr:2-deoxyglucose-6-phosphate phosphatase, putative [Talaromyces stipitatus ATCC 10500]EED19128.1 2-deoxyglucose-6-phosphate phosphatase, putative [Talaromyces stipitatus ATCC 10500]